MKKPRHLERPRREGLVGMTVRVDAEAHRLLKSAAALEDMTVEEKARAILYPALGLEHLPVFVEAAAAT